MNTFQVFLIIGIMLFLNAIFAAYEMALAAITKSRLLALQHKKRRGAGDAIFMKDRIEASLAVIQLGITMVSAIAAAIGGANADSMVAPYLKHTFGLSPKIAEFVAFFLIVIPLSAFTITFAELIPKNFALANKEWVCLRLSPFMKILYFIFYPIANVLEQIVKITTKIGSKKLREKEQYEASHIHEVKLAASMARMSRLIGPRQEKIVHSATEISEKPVRDIMIPVKDMFMIPLNYTLSSALIKAHMDMHTRFPICAEEGNAQTIVGYVNFKDIVFALHANPVDPTLKGIVRPIKYVKADARISLVLEEMIQENSHIAIVKDEKEGNVGMLTFEDLLEELVGDIKDEYDRLPTYVHPYLSGWLIGGGVTMDTVSKTVNLPLSIDSTSGSGRQTLAEWCRAIKGKDLTSGESITAHGITITVRKLRRNQLSESLVIKL